MSRMRSPFGRKIVTVSIIAAFLFCTPLHLVAQERELRATADQGSVIAWLTTLWSDLTAWLAGEPPPPPPQPDGACSIDPWGVCRDNGS